MTSNPLSTLYSTDLSLDDLRVATLQSLLALAAQHGLRMPREISTSAQDCVGPCLRLQFERDADLDAWAAILAAVPSDHEDELGRHREFTLVGLHAPVWLAWMHVYGRCYAFNREPEVAQLATATLTPDVATIPDGVEGWPVGGRS